MLASGWENQPAIPHFPSDLRNSQSVPVSFAGTIFYAFQKFLFFSDTDGGTLIIFMSVRILADICRSLVDAGLAPGTPATLMENGTRPEQQVIAGDLDTLPHRTLRASLRTSALLIAREVIRLRVEM